MRAKEDSPINQSFYRGVPLDQIQRLQEFRARYPYASMEIRGSIWHYIDTGVGEQAILILAGATAIAEVSFNTIEHFARRNRVIAPDYPPIDNLTQLFEGYLELLDRLGVDRFVLMGGSYGGWMAQSLVRMAPERVDKLALSAIGPPNPENSRQLARMMWILKWIPFSLIRALMSRSFTSLVSNGDLTPEQLLLMAQVKEIMRIRLKRQDILALLLRLIDQTQHYSFRHEDLQDWPGKMLVLMGSDDPSTTPEIRQAMARLYPKAAHVVFEGADHSLAVTHKEAYYQALDAFLLN